jgi:uncharacterized protein (TIGR04255 family)
MQRIPRKLKKDPIVEAILELQFTSDSIPEIVLGRLLSNGDWANWHSHRLPLSNVPAPIREQDPNLVHQPLFQLQREDGSRIVKVGPNVLSYHALQSYPGWSVLEPELKACFGHLYSTLKEVIATRFGIRYLNVFTREHYIEDISKLEIAVTLAGEPLNGPLNLNYQRTLTLQHNAMIRIASVEFVQNPSPGMTALVDIDIFTPKDFRATSAREVDVWTAEAHDLLKAEFFTLLPDHLIDKLEEK